MTEANAPNPYASPKEPQEVAATELMSEDLAWPLRGVTWHLVGWLLLVVGAAMNQGCVSLSNRSTFVEAGMVVGAILALIHPLIHFAASIFWSLTPQIVGIRGWGLASLLQSVGWIFLFASGAAIGLYLMTLLLLAYSVVYFAGAAASILVLRRIALTLGRDALATASLVVTIGWAASGAIGVGMAWRSWYEWELLLDRREVSNLPIIILWASFWVTAVGSGLANIAIAWLLRGALIEFQGEEPPVGSNDGSPRL